MPKPQYDYGAGGFFGLVTPQANPTVEAEMRFLLPNDAVICTMRATSAADAPQQRLIEYIERLPETVAAFDSLEFDVAGFACTGSSYLVGPAQEKAWLDQASARLGATMISATAAIDKVFRTAGIRKIALIAPYPDALIEAGARYWSDKGYEVVETLKIKTGASDTRSIYALSSECARTRLDAAPGGVDAILVSGTGMPTLALYDEPRSAPVFSSNPCLAWAMLKEKDRQNDVKHSVQSFARNAYRASREMRKRHD